MLLVWGSHLENHCSRAKKKASLKIVYSIWNLNPYIPLNSRPFYTSHGQFGGRWWGSVVGAGELRGQVMLRVLAFFSFVTMRHWVVLGEG